MNIPWNQSNDLWPWSIVIYHVCEMAHFFPWFYHDSTMKFHEITMFYHDIMGSCHMKIPCFTMILPWCSTIKYHVLPRNTMKIPCFTMILPWYDTMKYHDIPWKYHGLPWYYHGLVPWNTTKKSWCRNAMILPWSSVPFHKRDLSR